MIRNHSLDVLRGIAILLVLLTHYAWRTRSFLQLGGIGVDLFFVLSGFLISGLLFSELQKHCTIEIRRFLIRRGFKIYPTFFVYLILTFPIMIVAKVPAAWSRLGVEFLFLQPYHEHLWAHTWSLGVEEHFYLILPLLVVWLYRRDRLELIPWIALFLIVCCSAGRILNVGNAPSNTHLRIDELFDGVLLGYLKAYRPASFTSWSGRRWIMPLGLLLLVPWFAGDADKLSGVQSLRLTCASLGFSLLVLWSQSRPLRNRVVELIGRHSYSIYIWHVPFAMLWRIHPELTALDFSAYLATVILVGIGVSVVIEAPFLNLRERVCPRRHYAVVLTPNSAALTPATVQATPV